MTFATTKATLTGSPDFSGWAQVHDFLPEEEEKQRLRGHLFAVVATGRSEEGVDAVTAGRELLSRLHEEYFGELTQTPFNALKGAIEKVSKEFSESWGNVEVVAISHIGDVVYSAAGGGAEISIFRNGMLAKILTSKAGEVASASGYPKEGDMLILGTKLFFETISGGVIKSSLEQLEPQAVVESLAPSVLSKPNTGSLGAVFVRFGEQGKKEEVIAPVMVEEKSQGPSVLSQAKASSTGFFEKVYAGVNRLVGSRLPERKIYVHQQTQEMAESRSKRTTLTVGAILLVLLVVSIFFGVRQKRIRDARSKYESGLSAAQHDYDEALNVSSSDIAKARQLFISSKTKVDSILASGVKDPAVTDLNQKLEQSRASILGEYTDEPQVFVDLSLLSDGLKGDRIVAGGGNAYVLDISGNRVVSVAEDTKESSVIAGPDQISGAKEIAAYENRVFVLSSGGIDEVGQTKTRAVDKVWQEPALIYAYTGNIYVLDKSASKIYRFAGTGTGFAAKEDWLAADVTADFSRVSAWTIDGTIWLLSSSGKISKFSLGSAQDFTISGVYPDLASPTAIYTDQDAKGFYILESSKNRVVVVDKNGNYIAQYVNSKISQATGLVVSEANKRIILLAGSKLYSLDIKHPIE